VFLCLKGAAKDGMVVSSGRANKGEKKEGWNKEIQFNKT
jgi:hypothetical protein